MENILNEIRCGIAEGGETALLILADKLDDEANAENNYANLAELFRCYVESQTFVRMSQPIPLELKQRISELQATFKTPVSRRVGRNTYARPLGVYYTGLTVTEGDLADQLDLLSIEPIRYLRIWVGGGDNLALILRNYRIDSMYQIELANVTRNNYLKIVEALRSMKGGYLQRLEMGGWFSDPQQNLPVRFRMNRNISKGAKLFINGMEVATHG